MTTKAILLDTLDYSDRPRDPPPISVIHQEMKEYCKRNNYSVIAEIKSNQKYIYEKNTELAKLYYIELRKIIEKTPVDTER